jgi:hypothetical protein
MELARPLVERERQAEAHQDQRGEDERERGPVCRQERGDARAPNTATSEPAATDPGVGCDALGAMNLPHTTAATKGAPSPSTH